MALLAGRHPLRPGTTHRSRHHRTLGLIGSSINDRRGRRSLGSWAGICPGQRESAGKRGSAKTRKGSKWLRTTLVECANAAARTKGTYLSERYRQVVRRRGHKKAIVAVAHTILRNCWHLLSTQQPYREAGPEAVRSLADEAARRRAIRQLQALGYSVTLHQLPQPA